MVVWCGTRYKLRLDAICNGRRGCTFGALALGAPCAAAVAVAAVAVAVADAVVDALNSTSKALRFAISLCKVNYSTSRSQPPLCCAWPGE